MRLTPRSRVVLLLEITRLGERSGTVRTGLLARLRDMARESLDEAAVAPERCEWFPTAEGVLLSIADSPVPIASTVLRSLHEHLDEQAARHRGEYVMALAAALDHGFVTVADGRLDGEAVRACTGMLRRAEVAAITGASPAAGLVVVTSDTFMRDVLRQGHRGTGVTSYVSYGPGAERIWVRTLGFLVTEPLSAAEPVVAPEIAAAPVILATSANGTTPAAGASELSRPRVWVTAAQAHEMIRRLEQW
jgi:hypothetical protein